MKFEVRIWTNPNGTINICRIRWVKSKGSEYMYSKDKDYTMNKLMTEIISILNTNNFNRRFRGQGDGNRNNARYETLMFIEIQS